MEIKVLNQQSILDIAIQYTGDVQNCFDIAVANGMAVSDLMNTGKTLSVSNNANAKADVLQYYTSKNLKPATGTTLSQDSQVPSLKGIGYMQLENSFKVS